ncbi:TPA: nucleoside triphosphate pyrophosphohydrolase, partial [Candidatus Galligastranaerophilus intestinavium]|nr:nucleoside triphosphate pyrophosphohydrolase [Candidatus Galligastranaerophilus intestinavium]
DTKEILANWEKLKQEEKPHRKSVLDGISKSQSALMKAQKISKKAVRVGFEWQNIEQLKECVKSEFREFEAAKTQEEKEEEFGDILFALVNLARWNKIDAEQALNISNEKFIKRFKKMEELTKKPLGDLSFDEWENLWARAKTECAK